jgi:hypothetical protein
MDLQGKTVLILGGSGLVGRAVARRLLEFGPARIVLVALYEDEVRAGRDWLAPYAGRTQLEVEWGDVFVPEPMARLERRAMLADPQRRALLLDDLLSDVTPESLERSCLYRLFTRHRPQAVVDCINTATAFAYRDVFHSARDLVDAARRGSLTPEMVEEHVLSIPMPHLIRHVQIMLECLRRWEVEAYVKIGTSGTGGMGFNIPYTHSEERPSRTLLGKSAVAGAHSLLLFLVARTPGAPATIEIKPTAAIAWREIAFGPIRRRGRPVPLMDCERPLPLRDAFGPAAAGWTDLGVPLEAVYADLGENGLFARDEFETVTALGQMEFVTPEEVAGYVVSELQGHPTGRDVITALDAATAGPTYQAGVLRQVAIDRLAMLEAEHDRRSVAFEMLGPPRLTKHLYEAFILSRIRGSVRALAAAQAGALAAEAAEVIRNDALLRRTIVSVGLPVLVTGDGVYRAAEVLVPPGRDVEVAASRGWVDLRAPNCEVWIRRARRIVEQAEARDRRSHSGADWGAPDPDGAIAPPRLATWIFRYEDGGERIKR